MIDFIILVVILAGICMAGEYMVWRDGNGKKWKNTSAKDAEKK